MSDALEDAKHTLAQLDKIGGDIAVLRETAIRWKTALLLIANSHCCDQCQEAARIAQAALWPEGRP